MAGHPDALSGEVENLRIHGSPQEAAECDRSPLPGQAVVASALHLH
jgi:hypothetical protein